ncbi:hypothetical protein N7504_000662 [Penicillium tannophilum]|nr:hypothetical protein N7504_000662 [Penicillium tannophilum]
MSDETIDPNYVWPLVLLTELSASDQAKLLGLVKTTLKEDLQRHSTNYFGASFQVNELPQEVNVRPWSPPLRLLNSVARQGPCRDSQNNIHALAVLAYRSGRPRIIIADEATKRQLSGKYLPDVDLASPNDQSNVTVILVCTRRDTQSGEITIFARRAICSSQEGLSHIIDEDEGYIVDEEDFIPGTGGPDPQPLTFKCVHRPWRPLWAHGEGFRDMIMHDPYKAPFTSRTGDILGKEYCTRATVTALGHHLPPELVLQICNTRTRPKMPLWDRRPSEKHVVIFLMYPSTAQEREKTVQNLKDSPYGIDVFEERVRQRRNTYPHGVVPDSPDPDLPKYNARDLTFELIPWEQHRMATRLDLLDFWDEYRAWDVKGGKYPDSMPLICMREPMVDWSYYLSVFIVLTCKHGDYPSPVVMRKASISDIWKSMAGSKGFNKYWYRQYNYDGIEEEFWHPERPFFYNPAPWSSMLTTKWHRTVFFLTNQLTGAAKESLEQTMLRIHELDWDIYGNSLSRIPERPEYSFVPWKSGEAGTVDGKLRDIWSILQDLYKHPYRRSFDPIRFVCVDKRFEVDQSVILVEADMYEHPGHDLLQHLPFPALRGFEYTRAPAGMAYCENLNWVDGVSNYDGWMAYRRQGWPAPRLLPDYDSGSEGSEQSDHGGDSPSSLAGKENLTRDTSGGNYYDTLF